MTTRPFHFVTNIGFYVIGRPLRVMKSRETSTGSLPADEMSDADHIEYIGAFAIDRSAR
jgi:hypothetical protein